MCKMRAGPQPLNARCARPDRMSPIIIAGNWKMNMTVAEARDLVAAMIPGLEAVAEVVSVVFPPFVALETIGGLLRSTDVGLGAQNLHYEDKGAFTGEVSASMLAALCEFVIVGHSERRHVFGESDEAVGRKVEAAQRAGLRPVLCVGERLGERESGSAEAVVERQLRWGLANAGSPDGLVVAYEPVWAIGTGRAATPDDAQLMMASIRATLASVYDAAAAADVPLLYGGSVTADNVAELMSQDDVNGALVGGASLVAEGFVELVRNAAAVA